MDGMLELLDAIRERKLAAGRFRGVLHVCIGRRVTKADGTLVGTGLTWRQLAEALKAAKYDKELAREVGVDPDTTSPRDREKMWYAAIAAARVDAAEAVRQADDLAVRLKPYGFVIGPAPTGAPSASHPPVPAAKKEPVAKPKPPDPPADGGAKKKK